MYTWVNGSDPDFLIALAKYTDFEFEGRFDNFFETKNEATAFENRKTTDADIPTRAQFRVIGLVQDLSRGHQLLKWEFVSTVVFTLLAD